MLTYIIITSLPFFLERELLRQENPTLELIISLNSLLIHKENKSAHKSYHEQTVLFWRILKLTRKQFMKAAVVRVCIRITYA